MARSKTAMRWTRKAMYDRGTMNLIGLVPNAIPMDDKGLRAYIDGYEAACGMRLEVIDVLIVEDKLAKPRKLRTKSSAPTTEDVGIRPTAYEPG